MKTPYKILIVDDDPMLLKATQLALKPAGYDILTAASGEEALQLVQEQRPDLILLDVNMPGVDGLEVCRQIKASPELAGTYVILFSASKTGSDAQSEGLDIGADGYITRPIPNRELLARVQAMLRLKTAEQALQRTSEDLKRSNEELEQFAYVASHDLREPLRMVTSYLKLIEKRYKGKLDADADEFIGFAMDGAERMQRMINDLLKYSRVGTQGQPFTPTPCEHALNHALENLQVAIEESGAQVTHDPLPEVLGDESQLVQLFQNLVDNAIKFRKKPSPVIARSDLGDEAIAPARAEIRLAMADAGAMTDGTEKNEPPQVHISAAENPQEWVFAVRDNGIGIDPKYNEWIFTIFQRLHEGEQDPAGSGIGLAMCKKIVQRHGGRIWVESQPGQGATFYFTLLKGQ